VDFFLICHESPPKLDPSLEISPRFACGQYIPTYLLTYFHAPTYSCILVCCGYLLWKLLWVVWQSSHAYLSLSHFLSLFFSLMSSTYLLSSSLTFWVGWGSAFMGALITILLLLLLLFECKPSRENWGFQQTKRLFSIVTKWELFRAPLPQMGFASSPSTTPQGSFGLRVSLVFGLHYHNRVLLQIHLPHPREFWVNGVLSAWTPLPQRAFASNPSTTQRGLVQIHLPHSIC
jgi:hypothetical protein